MNLEQAMIECTAAITRLTTVLVNNAEALTAPTAAPAPAADVSAPKRTKKAAATSDYPVNEGDAAGTRYFHIPSHNTVYKQAPGDADCTLSGAVIVSGAEYLAQKDELAKKFPTASAAETPAPVISAPTATAPVEPAFEQVIAAMRKLHAAKQNDGVMQVLKKYGVTGVPALNGKASNVELIAEIEAVTNV